MMIEVTTKEDRAKFYSSSQWKKLRLKALERDHYECQWCKEQGKVTTINDAILEVDHIKELEYHPEFATDIDNLRTLCKECHNKRHSRMNYRGAERKKKFDDEWW